jgi:hypothetical protein
VLFPILYCSYKLASRCHTWAPHEMDFVTGNDLYPLEEETPKNWYQKVWAWLVSALGMFLNRPADSSVDVRGGDCGCTQLGGGRQLVSGTRRSEPTMYRDGTERRLFCSPPETSAELNARLDEPMESCRDGRTIEGSVLRHSVPAQSRPGKTMESPSRTVWQLTFIN